MPASTPSKAELDEEPHPNSPDTDAKDLKSQFVPARAIVVSAERLTPSFMRITFGGPDLHNIGTSGKTRDQRVKLIFPGSDGRLPQLSDDGDGWHEKWISLPEENRGVMRTYSIRDLLIDGSVTQIVIDFVLHPNSSKTGSASSWAEAARPGDEVCIVGPRRGSENTGGAEFNPGNATRIVLAGDETAAPAIARILEDAAPESRGIAFIEIPTSADILPIRAPKGFEIRWLPRESATHGPARHGEIYPVAAGHGALLLPAVIAYLCAQPDTREALKENLNDRPFTIGEPGPGELLWETPNFSALGEEVPEETLNPDSSDRYFWIAGESQAVTSLRRHLVNHLGIQRSQVAFMGYWRKGVSMHA